MVKAKHRVEGRGEEYAIGVRDVARREKLRAMLAEMDRDKTVMRRFISGPDGALTRARTGPNEAKRKALIKALRAENEALRAKVGYPEGQPTQPTATASPAPIPKPATRDTTDGASWTETWKSVIGESVKAAIDAAHTIANRNGPDFAKVDQDYRRVERRALRDNGD